MGFEGLSNVRTYYHHNLTYLHQNRLKYMKH